MGNGYDVVVVGAGPAGSAAAKAAAEKGAKTILLEEHTAIGLPQHCLGRLPGTTKSKLTDEIIARMPRNVVVEEVKSRRVFAPSGKMVKEFPLAGTSTRLIRRDLFDLELAKEAANAGADIALNTRVTSLLKENGKVVGVVTNSRNMPSVYGKIVIAADGIYAALKGIPKWEGLAAPDEVQETHLMFELTRVKDIEPGVLEYHACGDFEWGRVSIFPLDNRSCWIDTNSMAEFERIKSSHYAVSKKLKDAVPVRMTGFPYTANIGKVLPKIVADGLILAGSAAKILGILDSMLSGRYAGEVAVAAIQEGDVTGKRLSIYEELCQKYVLLRGRGSQLTKFAGLSDEVIEQRLPELIEKGQLDLFDVVPF